MPLNKTTKKQFVHYSSPKSFTHFIMTSGGVVQSTASDFSYNIPIGYYPVCSGFSSNGTGISTIDFFATNNAPILVARYGDITTISEISTNYIDGSYVIN